MSDLHNHLLFNAMGLPGQKRGKTSKRMRASHFALKKIKLVPCPKCGKPTTPHRVCKNCGTYRGRTVIAKKTSKKNKKTS